MTASPSLPLLAFPVAPPADTLLRPADLEAYAREMPIASVVLPRLQSLLLAENTSISDIVDLVMLDPGLAARIIQSASSAIYGRPPVTSLGEALARLGSDEVYRVTAAFALSKFLNRPLRCYGVSQTEYWRRSLACALVMVDLAPASGLDERVAYTVGLLHALGMVFIDRHLRCVGAPNLRFDPMQPGMLPKAEVTLTGMHHARAAGFVLRAWNFSDDIIEPIEHQLAPGGAIKHRAMASLLAEASSVAAELAPKLELPGRELTLPLPKLLGDDWRISIAEKILAIEGHQF